MHISEGVLSGPILIAGAMSCAVFLATGLRRMEPRKIPEVALLTSAFFIASLLHIPIGPSSSHLLLNGLLGILLGWAAFPAIFVGLFLQAILFQFGGLTTLGVNTVNMALPAVLTGFIVRPLISQQHIMRSAILTGLCGGAAVLLSGFMVAACLALSGESLTLAGKMILMAHIPVAVVETLIAGAVITAILKSKPEMINGCSPALKAVAVLSVFALTLTGGTAHAHRVNIFAWWDGSAVQTESYFASGTKAINAKVEMKDAENNTVATCRTDNKGRCTLTAKEPGRYRITVYAGMGHKADTELIIGKDSLAEGKTYEVNKPVQVQDAGPTASSPLKGESEKKCLTQEDIDRIIEKRLRPLYTVLERIEQEQHKVRIKDVAGGIGYILGLAGIALYVWSRRKT
jgi:cobalt/nickel transport system permease protein